MTALEETLRAQLAAAMRLGDTDATRVLRAALAAIENAQALPADDAPAVGARDGVARAGAPESPRCKLTEDDEFAIVRAEIDARSRAASGVAASEADAAARLRREAEILTIALAQAGQ